jgi:hypothetical protein
MVCSSERVGGLELQRGLVARLLALQRRLDLRQRVAVAAMQVGRGLFGLVDQLALGVRHPVADGDDGVFLNVHDREG